MSNWRVFGLSILGGFLAILAVAAYTRDGSPPTVKSLIKDISVTEQLEPKAIEHLRNSGFATIIDLRPDGEARDQPSSAEIAVAVQARHMTFSYVPVPHGDISDEAVIALAGAIANSPKPILLYCRSGRRAARTWSLVEASRSGGMDSAAILAAVGAAGQSADDLRDAITTRISLRPKI